MQWFAQWWKTLSLRYKFFIFLLSVSILPTFFLFGVATNTIAQLFESRIERQLFAAEEFVKTLLLQQQRQVELSVKQIAYLSLYPSYQLYLRQHNSIPLSQMIHRYAESKQLDYVSVKDYLRQHKEVVIDNQCNLNENQLPTILNSSKTHAHWVVVSCNGKKPQLASMVVTPIISKKPEVQLVGQIVVVKRINLSKIRYELSRVIPDATFQLIPASELDKPLEKSKDLVQKQFLIQTALASPKFGGVVAVNTTDMALARWANGIYMWLYMGLAMIAIMLMGYWFHHTYILPVQGLMTACQAFSLGKKDVRCNVSSRSNEVADLINRFNALLDSFIERDTLKQHFMATLTHDLRTPITSEIRVLESLLEDSDQLQPRTVDILGKVKRANEEQLEMINQLLEVFHFEEGRVVLSLSKIDIPSLIDDIFEQLVPLATDKEVKLVNEVQNLWLEGDAMLLKRVFLNLISNAIANLQDQGQITISAKHIGGQIEIVVADNGPGIDEETRTHLFDRFAFGKHLKKKLGSGFGLPICGRIIALHHGTISVIPNPTGGTQFVIQCPQVQAHTSLSAEKKYRKLPLE